MKLGLLLKVILKDPKVKNTQKYFRHSMLKYEWALFGIWVLKTFDRFYYIIFII